MSRHRPRRLQLKRETLRRLADRDLARAAGGYLARCTYEKSGCYGQTGETWWCGGGDSEDCGSNQM